MRNWTGSATNYRHPGGWSVGESWKTGAGGDSYGWHGIRRRFVRVFLGLALFLFVIPVAFALVLAATIGGWTAVAIVVLIWLAILLSLAIGARVAIRSFSPIRDLIETTGRLSEGNYAARVTSDAATPLRPVVESINNLAERLETSDELRQRLLADVGHELRTPLTIVRGELEAMADGVRAIDQQHLATLLTDVAVMERLLDDLRTLSTAEAGRLKLYKEPTDVVSTARDAISSFEATAVAAGVDLSISPSSDVAKPIIANVDPVRLREVLNNLIANAIRAAASGGLVNIDVAPVEGTDDDGVRVLVSDDGVGMTEEEVSVAFERFHKGPTSDGSGLGLTISRDLIEAHGGAITIESAVDSGTTVTLSLPGPPGG